MPEATPDNAITTSERYVCIHGHFYQPPRENPWLETVETQDSAAPYHDWNDRITSECYAPNGASRIVNHENEITRILNNYARISFNFGPTLLSWLEENASRVYRNILSADRRSQARFGGHGSAMGQVYNHIIMPLANTRDRVTQVRWGIVDFESRFGRRPEGMWLAETAVDTETLEILADHGILFTVLAPSQCARVRPLPKPKKKAKGELATKPDSESPWQDTPNASVDTRRPYVVRLKTGRSIAIFFYDGARSRAIAFEGLLNSGDTFADRLLGGFHDAAAPQLVHVATDGESYGHHHRYGEMALSYALTLIEQQGLAKLTNYGEFLEKFPPEHEAQIYENTSWSCFHGVERWRSDCGCNGGKAGWHQRWRAPLREALDWLRDSLASLTEKAGKDLFTDVWAARDGYIEVVLARSHAGQSLNGNGPVGRFLAAHALHSLDSGERVRALQLMEMQRHALLMYTSCGWFFDDISGIETVQIIAYAGRALQLAAELFGAEANSLEAVFTDKLRTARSNDPAAGDGAEIYRQQVKATEVNLDQVAAHYAISSLFTSYPNETQLFCYGVRRIEADTLGSGGGRLSMGRARISSQITGESEMVTYAALHFGDENITAAVKRCETASGEDQADPEHDLYQTLASDIRAAIAAADVPAVIRLFDRYFGGTAYSLLSLFTDEQRRILKLILHGTLKEVETNLSAIYENHASLLHFLTQAGLPKPPSLTLAAGFAINAGLRHALESDVIDSSRVHTLLDLAKADQVALDTHLLGYIAGQRMKRAMIELQKRPEHLITLDHVLLVARILSELPFDFSLWQAQNIWYDILELARRQPLVLDAEEKIEWEGKFDALGRHLHIAVEQLVIEDELMRNSEAIEPSASIV